MEPSKNFEEFKRILTYKNCSIVSKKFYIKYCKKNGLTASQCDFIKPKLDQIFPFNNGGWAPVTHSELGAVVAIMPESKAAEDKLIFGYASFDHFNNLCFLPDTGKEFLFKGMKNKEKLQEHLTSLNENNSYFARKHYFKSMEKYLNTLMKVSWATSLDLNFVVDYPEPLIKGGSTISGLCWNTLMTDNEIHLDDEL